MFVVLTVMNIFDVRIYCRGASNCGINLTPAGGTGDATLT